MPYLIKNIDAIAREKQRDVLFITFSDIQDWFTHYDWEKDHLRANVINFLNEHSIGWQECGEFANDDCLMSYQGQIYVDLELNEKDEKYRILQKFLENPDGSMRHTNITFWLLTLERALTNKAHDEDGFWEKWAENF